MQIEPSILFCIFKVLYCVVAEAAAATKEAAAASMKSWVAFIWMINLVGAEGFGQKHGVVMATAAESFCYSMASTSRPISFSGLLQQPLLKPAAFSFPITNLSLSYLPGNHGTSTQKSLDAFTIGLGDSLSRTTGRKGLHCDISQGQLQAKSLRCQATSWKASGQFACRSHRRVSSFSKKIVSKHRLFQVFLLDTVISRL